jgi:hypothetical protein
VKTSQIHRFAFNNISLEGYLLRSSTNRFGYNPKNWKLKITNNNVSWVQFEQHINRNRVTLIEIYFLVSSKESCSHFNFTQIETL